MCRWLTSPRADRLAAHGAGPGAGTVATGTAAGPLVARLAAAGQVADISTAIVGQGYALGRPSRIHVKVAGQQVQVGGSGLVAADGTLHLAVPSHP
jgi:predicted PhzF superfamily epimerase YddE/YHI9